MDIINDIIFIFKDGIEIGLIWALLAIGVFVSFRILDFADLTVEGSITLGSVIMATTIISNGSILLGTILAVSSGFIAGAFTGILNTKFKIPPILSGIITMTALFSINLIILVKASVTIDENATTIFSFLEKIISDNAVATILTSLLIIMIISTILYYIFGTKFGMSVRATGMNVKMAKAQGINTDLMIIFGLALSNGIIALGGALIAQSDRNSNLDLGRGTIVIGLASIIIGEAIFGKRSFKNSLISVILGSIVFQILVGIAIEIGLNSIYLKLIQAILIAIILAMPEIKKLFKNREVIIND